jgi:hypothetical protein
MKNYPIVVLFFLATLQISPCFAQKIVEGHILSEKSKQPLPYAMVQGMGENAFVYADEQGSFRITLSDSTEKLLITSSGFLKREMTIPLQAKRISFDISLKQIETNTKKEAKANEKKKDAKLATTENAATVVPNGQPQPLNLKEIREKISNSFAEDGIEGNVSLRVLVNEEGKYISHILLDNVHPILASEVEKYIKDIRFAPILQNGKAIKFSVNVQFNFKLE